MVLNGSATEIRSLALPGHAFQVVALDGNPVPNPSSVPVLWLGTAGRISAIVEMKHPGVWIMGDLADDDRQHGMGIVIEYAGSKGKAEWIAPPPHQWNYGLLANEYRDFRANLLFDRPQSQKTTYLLSFLESISLLPGRNEP